MEKTPRAGEIYYLTKDKPYQIITMGIHKETCQSMVIYQALFGDYATFVLPLSKFMEELPVPTIDMQKPENNLNTAKETESDSKDKVNEVLLRFLDADSYTGKLEIITTNTKAMDNRLINDMAASLDCTVEDGPIDYRLQELIYCLKQLSRFEVRRR